MASPRKSAKITKDVHSKYVEGSIVRIKLDNFLTYDSVEFSPGPYLNVIIGPNGTGKSSIVCAIALGLAAKTSVLGRAKEIQDFVKHGCQKALIELELHNPSGDNWVIKREISKKDGTSKWSVNNRPASMKSVEEMVARLNIQIGNLCQFLPQDKVADFAKMTQQELLENTEKAVGGQDMYDNHQVLKSARERGRQLELSYTRILEHLEQEKAKNARLEQDVKNFKERQHHLDRIKTLQMKRPWVEYEEKRKQYVSEKEHKEKLEKEFKEAMKLDAPLRKRLENAKKEVGEFEALRKKKDEEIRNQAKTAASKSKVIEELTEQLDDCDQELDNKRNDEKKRQKKLAELNTHLVSLQNEQANIDVRDVQPEIDRVTAEMKEVTRELSRITQEYDSSRVQQDYLRRDISGIQGELRKLQDVSNQRLQILRTRSKHAYDAVMWLRDNTDKFKAKIHEPIMTVINVTDPVHAKYIETHIPSKDMFAFVCEDEDDLEKFMKELKDKQGLKVNAGAMPPRSSAQFQPPKPIGHYRKHGFFAYLKDLFTCPEAVMRYICQLHQVFKIPVGDKQTKAKVEDVIKSYPELSMFYTDNHRYSVKKSKYTGDASTSSSEIKSPSVLTRSVDKTTEQQLSKDLQAKQDELKKTEQAHQGLNSRRQDLEKQTNILRNQKKELQERKNLERTIAQKIAMKQTSIAKLEGEGCDLAKEEATTRAKMRGITSKKIKHLGEMKNHTKKCLELSKEKVQLCMQHTQCVTECTRIEAELRDQSQHTTQLEREFTVAKEQMKRTKDAARDLLKTAKSATNTQKDDELSQELRDAFETCPNTLDEIDSAIHEEQARADCTLQTDETVVEDYQRRKIEIGKLEKKADELKKEVDGHQAEIDRTKAMWLEPLKSLVSRINEQFGRFFAQMRCAGEVDLHVPENPEDYEKYGVKIKVKFRDTEQMQELTSHYQSGGEKSVATVLYMMSLQELTQCPFRCVDEINQGMDPNNERKVFELVVRTACREGTSQYFLLTPKLLPDLEYSERMTVLCVFNGPCMMHHRDWSLKKFLKRRAMIED